ARRPLARGAAAHAADLRPAHRGRPPAGRRVRSLRPSPEPGGLCVERPDAHPRAGGRAAGDRAAGDSQQRVVGAQPRRHARLRQRRGFVRVSVVRPRLHRRRLHHMASRLRWLDQWRRHARDRSISPRSALARAGHASAAQPSFWWLEDGGGAVAGAAHLTPPYPLLVSSLPDGAAAALVRAARERAASVGTPVRGVNGPRSAAETVARAWTTATGTPHHLRHILLLHELERWRDVPRPRGGRREATSDDLDLVARWLEAFAAEMALIQAGVDQRRAASVMLDQREVELWEVDGTPVSLAGHRGPAAGVVRIGPVYTPPAQRNHGYARRL